MCSVSCQTVPLTHLVTHTPFSNAPMQDILSKLADEISRMKATGGQGSLGGGSGGVDPAAHVALSKQVCALGTAPSFRRFALLLPSAFPPAR